MRTQTILIVWGCCLLLAPSTWANTRHSFGTIMEVDADGTKQKAPSFRVLFEFHCLQTSALWGSEWYKFDEGGRYGKRVYFLDGRPSNPREAVKPGRAVLMTDNNTVVFVSSRPGPRSQSDPGRADAALYRIELPGAFQATAQAIDYGKPGGQALGEPKPVKGLVKLLFEVSGTEVRGVTLVVACGEYRTDFAADEIHLVFANDTISGTISTVFDFSDRNKAVMHAFKPKEGDRIPGKYSLKIQTDAKGVASGSFEGSCGATKVAGNLTGERLGRVEVPAPTRVWLQLGQLGSYNLKYVVFDVDQGKAKPGGVIINRTGRNPLTLTARDVTLAGTRIKGVLKGFMEAQKPVEIVLDGAILANRLILGSCIFKNEEGEEIKDRFRGGFTFQDGPQMHGCTAEQWKTVKELQAAAETKK